VSKKRETKEILLSSGATLLRIWDKDAGWYYVSDEIRGGVNVWFPALIDASTVQAALNDYQAMPAREKW
jgi:hypothetical protein